MKAVVIREHGGIDKLRLEDVPKPKAGAGEVLIRVRACALNHLDLWTRKGMPGRKVALPRILGTDIAGVVEEVGEGVERVKVGDEVVVFPGISCGSCEYCISGKENYCPSFKLIGQQVDGGYAEYVKVPEENVFPKPEGKSFEETAALPVTFLTAWHMLVTRAKVKPSDVVLVWAGGSGVGNASIQIAKLFNATVIATAGTDEKVDRLLKMGVDHAINHRKGDVLEEVMNFTGGKGVDVVVEHVGAATWEASMKSLKKGGTLVTCGATTGKDVGFDIRHLYSRQLSVLGTLLGTKGEFSEVLKLFSRGLLNPAIHKVYEFERVAEAQKEMEESKHFGKIVLRL